MLSIVNGYPHHFVFGIVLALLFMSTRQSLKSKLILLFLIPTAMEIVQFFMPDRTFDVLDICFSWIGSFFCVTLFKRKEINE